MWPCGWGEDADPRLTHPKSVRTNLKNPSKDFAMKATSPVRLATWQGCDIVFRTKSTRCHIPAAKLRTPSFVQYLGPVRHASVNLSLPFIPVARDGAATKKDAPYV
jgi:hypothetical protein